MKKLLIILFVCSFLLELEAQNKFTVTCLNAGNCNNFLILDEMIDSFLSRKAITHKYLLIGITTRELNKYSEKIFGKNIDSLNVLSKTEIQELGLEDLKPGDISFFCNKSRLFTYALNEFLEKINISDLINCETKNELKKFSKIIQSDSLVLNYKNKTLINDFRNGNNSSYVINGGYLYGIDPIYNSILGKINIRTGQIFCKKRYSNDIDPLKIYKIAYGEQFNRWDSLLYFDSLYNTSGNRINIQNMFLDNDKLYLLGRYDFLTYETETKNFINLSHNIIIVYDTAMNFIDYYIDPLLTYNRPKTYTNMYPLILFNSFFLNDSLISGQFIYDYFTTLETKYIMYFKLRNNLIIKHSIDSIIIPPNLVGNFISNKIGYFINLNEIKNPVWLMYPMPLLNYGNDGNYYNLLNDSLCKSTDVRKEFTKLEVMSIAKTTSDSIFLSFIYGDNCYTGLMDLKNQKFKILKDYGNLKKFGLKLLLDTDGKCYCFPINNEEKNNFIYELN